MIKKNQCHNVYKITIYPQNPNWIFKDYNIVLILVIIVI